MSTIWQVYAISKFSSMNIVLFGLQLLWNVFPWISINNKSILVIMAWCLTSNESLSEPTMAYFTDACKTVTQPWYVKCVIFQIYFYLLMSWVFCIEIALRQMPQDLTNDWSTLTQVMDWCPPAPSHYLNQCWPSSIAPYVLTRGH